MKKDIAILLTGFLLIFYSCSKEKETNSYERGIYKPYTQVISPISAITKDGLVDGSKIKVTLTTPDVISGSPAGYSSGEIHFIDFTPNSDPLRDPSITIDSIYLTSEGVAYIYPNIFNLPPKRIERVKDSLFLSSPLSQTVIKFSPHHTPPFVIVTDSNEAKLHSIQTGKFLESGFVLFSYNIYVKSSSAIGGIIDANYLDLDYLKNQLHDGDTLVYVKKETYFKKN